MGPVLQTGYLPGQSGYDATGGPNQTNAGGGVYLQGLSIEGLETGMIVANTAWVRLRNCGVAAYGLLTGNENNAAMCVQYRCASLPSSGSLSFCT